MSTVLINRFSDNRIKRILVNKLQFLSGPEKEIAKDFVDYPRLNFNNTELIASLLEVDPEKLFEKKEISSKTLNYRNKKNTALNEDIDSLLLFVNEIDKQYKIYGDIYE